jgi:hypothetical protein
MIFHKMSIDLYNVRRGGMMWERVERNKRDRERFLQRALQSPRNQRVLGLGRRRVRWVGREFASADFFGIDGKWGLIFVETKVSSQQGHLAAQLRRRVRRFVGMGFKNLDERIWKYIRGRTRDGSLSFSCVLLTPYLRKKTIAVARIEF